MTNKFRLRVIAPFLCALLLSAALLLTGCAPAAVSAQVPTQSPLPTVGPVSSPSPVPVPSASPEQTAASSNAIPSPNNDRFAEIVRQDDEEFDVVVFHDQTGATISVKLSDLSYTGIEQTEWIDNDRFSLLAHVNPSLQAYVVIDAANGDIAGTYEGIGFTWNNKKNKLYYVQTRPHFSQEGNDSLVDDSGNLLYQAASDESIEPGFAISDNEERFAFFISNEKTDKTKLLLAKRGKSDQLDVLKTLDIPEGTLSFNGSTLRVRASDGTFTDYDMP